MRLIDADKVKSKLQQHRDLFVDAWGGFQEMSLADKSRVDEIDNCIAEIINAPTIEATPVVHGRWEWFEEWSPSTPDAPRECESAGWRCGRCKNALEDMVGGYWDNPDEEPNLNYCPNCGAKMDGGVSDG